MTSTGMLVGTTNYMPPEQWTGGRLDARVDVYSLGYVLLKALTGHVPFERNGHPARMYAQLTQPPPKVSSLVPAAAPFDEVIARALAKNPDDRYPSAGDLGHAALAAAEGHAVTRAEHSVAVGEAARDEAARAKKAVTERMAAIPPGITDGTHDQPDTPHTETRALATPEADPTRLDMRLPDAVRVGQEPPHRSQPDVPARRTQGRQGEAGPQRPP